MRCAMLEVVGYIILYLVMAINSEEGDPNSHREHQGAYYRESKRRLLDEVFV